MWRGKQRNHRVVAGFKVKKALSAGVGLFKCARDQKAQSLNPKAQSPKPKKGSNSLLTDHAVTLGTAGIAANAAMTLSGVNGIERSRAPVAS